MTIAIYPPRGRAAEYAEFAANLYSGCSHGCLYCWSPAVLHKSREEFAVVKPRLNILAQLEKDATKLAATGYKGRVLLCFTCDPYQPAETRHLLTRGAIEALHRHGLGASILSKGGTLAQRDLDLLGPADAYGATLTCIDKAHSDTWEPGAVSPVNRTWALKSFHEHGIPTWASLEPVLYPDETLKLIMATHGFVDEYRVGKLNYHPHAKTIDWTKFAHDVVALLDELGCRYVLKTDLRRYLP